jgi:hypothetical protein
VTVCLEREIYRKTSTRLNRKGEILGNISKTKQNKKENTPPKITLKKP